MISVNILLDTAEKIKRFTAAMSGFETDCEIVKDHSIIDAQSVMGIFSLSLDKPVKLNIYSDNTEITEKIKEFIV